MKFRVWCKNKNEWEKDEVLINQNGNLFMLTAKHSIVVVPIKSETHIVQYSTGLRDKKGEEIYQGDIVTHNTNIMGDTVVWFGGAFRLGEGLKTHTLLNRIEGCEVIGNIYENPELLKGE